MLADISVIIPAYNRAGLIGETLQSLLNQTVPAKEIILVDDGSTDGTAEEVEHEFSVFREQFSGNSKSNIPNPIFKVLRQQNAGPGAARNRGLAEATGEFIHFFDSDDIASPNKHEEQLRALLETGADIACGPWVKGRFAPKQAQTVASGELSVASLDSVDTRYHLPATIYSGFTPEGPVLQAKGLPKGDWVRALLTNWSIVPHACLFRRSILEKAGGFPEDIWVGEDQLLFLRCLLAGAKVVHTPETIVFYRLGNDPGKLTATGAAQKRHARDWARFLVKANEEVASGERRVAGKRICLNTIEHGGKCEKEQPKVGPKGEGAGATESKSTEGEEAEAGPCLDKPSGVALSNPYTSELARDPADTSLTRSADDLLASRKQSDENPVNLVNPVKNCFGFRLRAYEAWRDLEKFFPTEEDGLKNELQGIWKRNSCSGFRFQVSGFLLRKLGGLKLRLLGYREHSSFRCGRPSRQ
jgi:glycosyltransferase involved in cell wall biosynthesis